MLISLLGLAIGLVIFTTCLHSAAIAAMAAVFRPLLGRVENGVRPIRDLFILVMASTWLMLAHAVEIAVWATCFHRVGMRDSLLDAYYLASLCYTTLGLDGLEIAREFEIFPGIVAANGFLLFGMSTAFLLEIFSRLRMNVR
ncbi:MAG: hypothetical protein AAF199_01380 [Pseudomonadota bacterium]